MLVIVMNLRDSDQDFATQLHRKRTCTACAFLFVEVVADPLRGEASLGVMNQM